MPSIRLSLALGAACAFVVTVPSQAQAQDIICCMQIIKVHGDWFGALRIDNCQDWFNKAPPPTLVLLCDQRDWLTCIDTSRCATLPASEKSGNKGAAGREGPPPTSTLPPDPDRDGVADGFGTPLPPAAAPPPSAGGVSPPRLVYLVRARSSGGGAPLTAFTVFLDRNACALPLAANGQPTTMTAAVRVVRGRVVRADGRVRVEAEAASVKEGTVLGKATGEAPGDDRAAVAAAARAAAAGLKLVCSR